MMSVKERLRQIEREKWLNAAAESRPYPSSNSREVSTDVPIRPTPPNNAKLQPLPLRTLSPDAGVKQNSMPQFKPPISSQNTDNSNSNVADNGAPPPLPKRPQPQRAPAEKARPPIPPKSISISGRLATIPTRQTLNETQIIELEETDSAQPSLQIIEPIPLNDNATATENDLTEETPRKVRRRQTKQTGLQVDAPKMFRSVSEGFQTAGKNVRFGAMNAWRNTATGTQEAFRTTSKQTQKALSEAQVALAASIEDSPTSRIFTDTAQDLSDLAKQRAGKPGLCSRCASLPLHICFDEQSQDAPAYLFWNSPLSRIARHSSWCRFCQMLLAMLCRKENDPLLLPAVRDHIEQDEIRGMPLERFIEGGFMNQDKYWPFGRTDERDEGSTQIVGPVIKECLPAAAKYSSAVVPKILTQIAIRTGKPATVAINNILDVASYTAGFKAGKEAGRRYRTSCTLLITVSGKQADVPGLLWVDLVGTSNAPGAEEEVFSHFTLRALKNGFAVSISPDRHLSYGHVLDPQWIDVSMGKLWLSECEMHHGQTCSEHGWAIALRKPTYLRLLDVQKLNITTVDDPSLCRYVALSYVWGSAPMVKLRQSNLEDLSRPHGLEEFLPQLPRTIVDAMEVVKEVGERYLWVDALCILQENTQESHDQIASMDAVFGSAVLTIVAADGAAAHAGLRGVRRKHFIHSETTGIPRQIRQATTNMSKGIDVIAPSSPPDSLSDSIWNSRAWTFQERLLSKRLLTFVGNEVVWHCRCLTAREDMPVERSDKKCTVLDTLELKPEWTGIGVDSHWKDGSFETTRHGLTHTVRSGTFAAYTRMIEQYSARNMTFEKDALNALMGLVRIFSIFFQSECIFGLPATLLDIALLWRPLEPLARRTGDFPSWSWVGWKGRVAYDDPTSIERDESGQLMQIEGIRSMLRYFVFDQHTGSLQPLNGTSRGLPLAEDEIPAEWEAHSSSDCGSSLTHSRNVPDLNEIDAAIIPHLSNKLLFFWTSTVDSFRLEPLAPQQVDRAWLPQTLPPRSAILDKNLQLVGNFLPESVISDTVQPGRHEFILMAEAQSSLLDEEISTASYPYYVIMLVDTDASSKISRRVGMGRVLKTAWAQARPTSKLIYLS